eukprot:c3680_g1_i1.p1 GENE.c3680_g1_i1~~c3680_g1_i1.p1  ORF type:complete len:138 (-),score=53.13 c3680_g1_i1:37-450(-)
MEGEEDELNQYLIDHSLDTLFSALLKSIASSRPTDIVEYSYQYFQSQINAEKTQSKVEKRMSKRISMSGKGGSGLLHELAQEIRHQAIEKQQKMIEQKSAKEENPEVLRKLAEEGPKQLVGVEGFGIILEPAPIILD